LILSFAVFYFVSLRNLSSEDLLEILQKRCFSSSPFDIIWLLDSFGKFFHNPFFTGPMDGLAIVAFLAVVFCFFRKKEVLFILLFHYLLHSLRLIYPLAIV